MEYQRIGVKIQVDGETIDLGKWVTNQKQITLKNIQGKTKEEIEEDNAIPMKDKEKIYKLLDLGIKPATKKTNSLSIGKATFNVDTQTCLETATLIDELVEEKQHKSTNITHSK